MAFTVDIFDEMLEKELNGWKDNNSEGYMVLQENYFDVEHNLEELERLMEESEVEDLKMQSECQPQRGDPTTSLSSEKSRSYKPFENTTT